VQTDRRFVFIVDNLDRLPGDEALEMWSTIRSFFLGTDRKGDAVATAAPIVVLPIDEEAIQRIYGKASDPDGGVARTQAFMEKTFDLTLRVTRPVQTEWHAYLDSQMKLLFGTRLGQDWCRRVGLYLESMFASDPTAPITPRRINAIANSIAVTWMQWHDSGIPFSSVAYYCVFRQRIDSQLNIELGSPKASVDRFDGNWARSIAALHFGVGPDIAFQVLLEGPLRKALIEGDSDKVSDLMGQPGFSRVFRRVIDQYGDATDPALVLSTINCLAKADSTMENFSEEWEILADALTKTPAWASFSDGDRYSVVALLDRIDGPSKEKVFASTLSHIINSVGSGQPGIAEGIGNLLVNVHDRHPDLLASDLTVPLPSNPETFVRVATICNTRPSLVRKLRSPPNATDVTSILVSDLHSADGHDAEARLRAVLATPLEVLTDAYLTEAMQALSRTNLITSAAALLALGLARSEGQPFAVQQVSSLAGNGRLAALVTESWVALDWQLFSRSVALLILEAPNALPSLQPPIEAKAIVFPQLGRQLDVALEELADNADTSYEALVDVASASLAAAPYLVAILTDRIRDGSSILPKTKALVDRFTQMQRLFSPADLTALISRYADEGELWNLLDTVPFSATVLSIFKELSKGIPAIRLKVVEVLSSVMKKVTETEWVPILAVPGDLYSGLELLSTLLETRMELPLLFAPLLSAQEQVITADNATWMARYFYLAAFLPPTSRQTVLRSLRDRILATAAIPLLVTLLNEGRDLLIADGHFVEKADDVVRRLIVELLEKPEILAYLHTYADALATTVAASHVESRQELARRLEEVSANGAEELNLWALDLVVRWGLRGDPTTSS